MKREQRIGQRFGRLVIIGVDRSGPKRAMFVVECDCGVKGSRDAGSIVSGNTISCGCRSLETLAMRSKGYNSGSDPTYCTWENMHNRCNPNNRQHTPSYAGIRVCERWTGRGGYENFLRDMGPRQKGVTLDRIDNLQGYSPANCRWATKKEQQNNRKVCRRLSSGETIQQFADSNGISYMKAWHKATKEGLLVR